MTDKKEYWEQELHRGLEQMDSWVIPNTVDIRIWEQRIVEERRIQRMKLKRELTIFWVIAVAVWILGLISLMNLPIVFIVLQVCALFGFPLFWVFSVRKKVAGS